MKITTMTAAITLCALAGYRLEAQARQGGGGQPQGATFRASSRATAALDVGGGGGFGARIVIDYGQPHARGREVWGTLVPFDTVWRFGADRATHLTTDVPLTIAGRQLPAGSYTLAMHASRTAPRLIVSSRTRQWGVPYDPEGELHRIPLRPRTLAEPRESLTITLVPTSVTGGTAAGTGTLVVQWGTMEYSVDFTAR
jgi:hypothetical protein